MERNGSDVISLYISLFVFCSLVAFLVRTHTLLQRSQPCIFPNTIALRTPIANPNHIYRVQDTEHQIQRRRCLENNSNASPITCCVRWDCSRFSDGWVVVLVREEDEVLVWRRPSSRSLAGAIEGVMGIRISTQHKKVKRINRNKV